jgi:cobalamin biosynthesis protein CobT
MDLMSRGKTWQRFQEQGRIDPARLSRVGVNVGTIFRKKLIREKVDTAMMLVCDLSGSMSGTKVRQALQLAMAFSEACELLDIPNEVVGFTTDYHGRGPSLGKGLDKRAFSRWEPLRHYIIKPFEKRFHQCKHAFVNAAHVGLANNVDGEAVLWAAKRLAKRTEQDLRMVVMSDGYPAACECNHSEIMRHLTFAVKKVEKAGIQCVGIGIQSDAVKRYYTDHVVFHELEDLVTGGYSKIASYFKRRKVKAR